MQPFYRLSLYALLLGSMTCLVAPGWVIAQPAGFVVDPTQTDDALVLLGTVQFGGMTATTGDYVAGFDEGYHLAGSGPISASGQMLSVPIYTDLECDILGPLCPDPGDTFDGGIDCNPACEMFYLFAYRNAGCTGGGGGYYVYPNETTPQLFAYSETLLGTVTAFTNPLTVWNFTGTCFPTLQDLKSALPVELLYFKAEAAPQGTLLNWATATEQNNSHFEIQRSLTGETFEIIGQVAGAGDSQVTIEYSYTDAQPLVGTSYYRLKQVDTDGTIAYSDIVTVEHRGGAEHQLSVLPNPFSNELRVVLPSSWAESSVQLSLRDLSGRQLRQWQWHRQFADTLPLTDLPAGVYVLTVSNGQEVMTQRIVKE